MLTQGFCYSVNHEIRQHPVVFDDIEFRPLGPQPSGIFTQHALDLLVRAPVPNCKSYVETR